MSVRIHVMGIGAFAAGMAQRIKAVERGTPEAVEKAAKIVLKEAKRRVPVDTGALKRSGRVETVGSRAKRGRANFNVGFREPYAIYVHEMTDVHHAVGEARYLANALNAKRKEVRDLMGSSTRSWIRRL